MYGNTSAAFCLTLSRRRKTSIILLWLTPDHFTRQGESSRLDRVKANCMKIRDIDVELFDKEHYQVWRQGKQQNPRT